MPLWSWGANSHSQLGLGLDSEQVDTPTKVVIPDLYTNVIQIACGGGHTLMIDENRALFSCGWNMNCQLGIGPGNDENQFRRVWPLSGIIFTNIVCGWDFSCGVSDTNLLIVWGSNKYGQLGLPKEQFPENVRPTRLQVNACSVSMGLRHTAILNSKGEVWVTGCGKHGQLGLGREILTSDRFQKVPNLKDISHIACGQNHTIAWSTLEKALYVWGDNKDGQLLIQYLDEKFFKIYIPQKIDIDVKQGVKKLLSGWKNVLLWLEDDTLLGWGRNNYHQLGIEAPFVGKPIKVQLPDGRRVKDVALGSEHTICLATDNTLWAWGWNEHANTGTGSNAFVIETPTLVCTDMFRTKITQIYAGAAQNFIVTDDTNGTDTTTNDK